MRRTTLLSLLACVALGLIGPASASAWAPAKTARITPGVMTLTDGAQCTANFVFQDSGSVYLGQAAHCSGTGESTDTDGCTSASLPLGTDVDINGTKPGKLVYNSWLTMQANGEKDPDACAYNDLALIKVDPADVASVNPSIPRFGGPTGLGSSAANLGDTVYSYGNSSLRQGVTTLSPKQGVVLRGEGNGWSRTVYTLTPGVPGDSGSGFLDGSGQAIGVLSTLQLAPTPAGNGVGDLRKELDYLHANSSFTGVSLVNGTEPFKPDLIGAILGG